MFWLSTSTVVRLRDQLLAAGQRASVAAAADEPPVDADLLKAEFGPICEAMYLMMSADGDVSTEERQVLRGALHNLSGSGLDGELVDELIAQASKRKEEEGPKARLAVVVEELRDDPARAEVAFVLAAAIAFADNAVGDEENETLDAIAEGLGIDEERADQLLDAVEKDLGSTEHPEVDG